MPKEERTLNKEAQDSSSGADSNTENLISEMEQQFSAMDAQPESSPGTEAQPSDPPPDTTDSGETPGSPPGQEGEKPTPFHEHPDWIKREQKHKAELEAKDREAENMRRQIAYYNSLATALNNPENILDSQRQKKEPDAVEQHYQKMREAVAKYPDDPLRGLAEYNAGIVQQVSEQYMPRGEYAEQQRENAFRVQYNDLLEAHPDFESPENAERVQEFVELYRPYILSGKLSFRDAYERHLKATGAEPPPTKLTPDQQASQAEGALTAIRQQGVAPAAKRKPETKMDLPTDPDEILNLAMAEFKKL